MASVASVASMASMAQRQPGDPTRSGPEETKVEAGITSSDDEEDDIPLARREVKRRTSADSIEQQLDELAQEQEALKRRLQALLQQKTRQQKMRQQEEAARLQEQRKRQRDDDKKLQDESRALAAARKEALHARIRTLFHDAQSKRCTDDAAANNEAEEEAEDKDDSPYGEKKAGTRVPYAKALWDVVVTRHGANDEPHVTYVFAGGIPEGKRVFDSLDAAAGFALCDEHGLGVELHFKDLLERAVRAEAKKQGIPDERIPQLLPVWRTYRKQQAAAHAPATGGHKEGDSGHQEGNSGHGGTTSGGSKEGWCVRWTLSDLGVLYCEYYKDRGIPYRWGVVYRSVREAVEALVPDPKEALDAVQGYALQVQEWQNLKFTLALQLQTRLLALRRVLDLRKLPDRLREELLKPLKIRDAVDDMAELLLPPAAAAGAAASSKEGVEDDDDEEDDADYEPYVDGQDSEQDDDDDTTDGVDVEEED